MTPLRVTLPPKPLEADSEPVLTFEIRLVSGEEGRALRMAQAEAIREILVWLRSERAGQPGRATPTGR